MDVDEPQRPGYSEDGDEESMSVSPDRESEVDDIDMDETYSAGDYEPPAPDFEKLDRKAGEREIATEIEGIVTEEEIGTQATLAETEYTLAKPQLEPETASVNPQAVEPIDPDTGIDNEYEAEEIEKAHLEASEALESPERGEDFAADEENIKQAEGSLKDSFIDYPDEEAKEDEAQEQSQTEIDHEVNKVVDSQDFSGFEGPISPETDDDNSLGELAELESEADADFPNVDTHSGSPESVDSIPESTAVVEEADAHTDLPILAASPIVEEPKSSDKPQNDSDERYAKDSSSSASGKAKMPADVEGKKILHLAESTKAVSHDIDTGNRNVIDLEKSRVEQLEGNGQTLSGVKATEMPAIAPQHGSAMWTVPVTMEWEGKRYNLCEGENPLAPPESLDSNLTIEGLFAIARSGIKELSLDREIVFKIHPLQLSVSEDNLYSRDTMVTDLIRLLPTRTSDLGEGIHIVITTAERFITQINDLFAELADQEQTAQSEQPPTKRARLD